jgi:hypothetical protein
MFCILQLYGLYVPSEPLLLLIRWPWVLNDALLVCGAVPVDCDLYHRYMPLGADGSTCAFVDSLARYEGYILSVMVAQVSSGWA